MYSISLVCTFSADNKSRRKHIVYKHDSGMWEDLLDVGEKQSERAASTGLRFRRRVVGLVTSFWESL